MNKWILVGIFTIVAVNIYSTYLVENAKNIYPHHKKKYILRIWLIPIFGFLIALFRTSLQYPWRPSPRVTDTTAASLDNTPPSTFGSGGGNSGGNGR